MFVLLTCTPTEYGQNTTYVNVHLDVIDDTVLDVIAVESYKPLVHQYAETYTRVAMWLQHSFHHYMHKPYIRHVNTMNAYSGTYLPRDIGIRTVPATTIYFSSVMDFLFLPSDV